MGSEIACLYVASSCTLLLVSVTDMIFSILVTSSLVALLASAGSFGSSPDSADTDGVVSASPATTFWGRPRGLGSPVGVFRLVPTDDEGRQLRSIGCLTRSFAPCSDLST